MPSFPSAEDLVLSADENALSSEQYSESLFLKIDLDALDKELKPHWEKIQKIVSDAMIKAAGPLYDIGTSEFIEGKPTQQPNPK